MKDKPLDVIPKITHQEIKHGDCVEHMLFYVMVSRQHRHYNMGT